MQGREEEYGTMRARAGIEHGDARSMALSWLDEIEREVAMEEGSALEGEIDRGSKSYIRWIQQQLNRIESAGLATDGVLGASTRRAIEAFQEKYSVVHPADGKPSKALEAFLIMFGATPPPGSPEPKRFEPKELPAAVYAAYRKGRGAWKSVLQRAIDAGIDRVNQLADIMFFLAHPERRGRQIQAGEAEAIREWNDWREEARRRLVARANRGPKKTPVFRIDREPSPDMLSGDAHGSGAMGACMGELLDLRFTTAPVYNRNAKGEPVIEARDVLHVRQGFLGNCPLIACLVAMAHVPCYRRQLERMITVESRKVQSFRLPEPYESCPSGAPPPKPAQLGSRVLYSVRFRRPLIPSAHVGPFSFSDRVVDGATVHVSGALYFDLSMVPPEIHYAHMVDEDNEQQPDVLPIWPAIIEKAYAVGRGNNSYEGINDYVYPQHMAAYHECSKRRSDCELSKGFDPWDVLVDLTGRAAAWPLTSLTDSKLMAILRRHERLPTVVDTKGDLPEGLIPANHALAVIGVKGSRASNFQVILLNAIDGLAHPFGLAKVRDVVDNVFQTKPQGRRSDDVCRDT